jgi:hypothetical protein
LIFVCRFRNSFLLWLPSTKRAHKY